MHRLALLALSSLSCACAAAPCPAVGAASPAQTSPAEGVARFRQAMIAATLRMDTPALVALWEDDGVSLLPDTPPLVGRAAIGEFIAKAVAQFPGARMRSFEMTCLGVELREDMATTYCDEHQVVDIPGKPAFDGHGRLFFQLHRGADGTWRLRREMWQSLSAP